VRRAGFSPPHSSQRVYLRDVAAIGQVVASGPWVPVDRFERLHAQAGAGRHCLVQRGDVGLETLPALQIANPEVKRPRVEASRAYRPGSSASRSGLVA